MKVTLRTILASPTHRGNPGDTIDVEPAFAKDLIAGGYASPATEPAPEPVAPAKDGAPAEPPAKPAKEPKPAKPSKRTSEVE